jgi:rhodanese-related sulfurtransferase
MKNVFVVVGILFSASLALAQVADTSIGEYASTLTKGGAVTTPPGCYGKAASNAADTFAVTKGGAQMLPPKTVSAWQTGQTPAPAPFVVIDVRPAPMYAAGHVPTATNLPLDGLFLPENLTKLPTDGQTSIVLVCQSGHTASMALGALVALGYQSVYVITGGTLAWKAAELPIES